MFRLDGTDQFNTTYDRPCDVAHPENHAHAAPALTKDHHLTHAPANPDKCEFCRVAKKKKFPARRLNVEKAVKTQVFNELRSIDLVDPGEFDVDSSRYLWTALDDYAKYPETYGCKSKCHTVQCKSYRPVPSGRC